MAVVLHLCSNKPASRTQTGSNRVVVVMRADARVPPPDLLRVSGDFVKCDKVIVQKVLHAVNIYRPWKLLEMGGNLM